MSNGLATANRNAIGLLKVLLAGSFVVPGLLFLLVTWMEYQSTVSDAQRELEHTSEVAREHAGRQFDSQSQVADRVNDLVRGMDAAAITRAQQPLHDAFAWIVARLPQVQSVLLVDADGRPLVSAGTYPVPSDVRLTDRDYFRAVVEGFKGTYVSALQFGEVNRQVFFGLSRPWLRADGKLQGVIDVAVLPSFFRDFYQVLVGEGSGGASGKVITLVRDDGQILVRYPPFEGLPPRAPPTSAFITAIRAHPDQGVYQGGSVVDRPSPVRLFSYRKVEGYPVYVVAGRDRTDILAPLRTAVANDLVFGIPGTLALVALTWTALVRTQREAEALARAREEIVRREQAEAALLAAQRLEAVGRMTGGVAHDFNNLLTMIMGGAESLQRRPGDPARVTRIAEQLMLAARRGGEITQQLLAFARRQPVKPEILDLNKQIREFEPLLQHAAQGQIRIDLELDAALAPVRLDPGQFEAALLNLVANARDAMPEGGRILIATRNVPAAPGTVTPGSGPLVRVAVSDTGRGMDEATAARAFEPFFTTKEVGSGTGLGLSQVYGFAKQAGGDAHIVTAPGRGTMVELLLPAAGPHGMAAVPDAAAAPPRDPAAGEVVLVVDDEPALVDLAVEHLRDLGYATLSAMNADAALERLQSGDRVDVLFSDVVMPGSMDGVQLSVAAARLRPGLKILLTSGYVASREALAEHDFPLLSKPYDRGQLAARLHAVLHD